MYSFAAPDSGIFPLASSAIEIFIHTHNVCGFQFVCNLDVYILCQQKVALPAFLEICKLDKIAFDRQMQNVCVSGL